MVYISILFILGIAYFVRFLDERDERKSKAKVEVVHQQMYDLIDEHFGDSPELAKEYKADADAYVCGVWKELGRDYTPTKVKQVTTAKERKERIKAENDGRGDIYRATKRNKAMLLDAIDNAWAEAVADARMADPLFSPTVPELGRERTINEIMGTLGMNREEATAHVEYIRKSLGLE